MAVHVFVCLLLYVFSGIVGEKISCTHQSGFCGMQVQPTAAHSTALRWMLASGRTQKPVTGPTSNHAAGADDTGSLQIGDKIPLCSPEGLCDWAKDVETDRHKSETEPDFSSSRKKRAAKPLPESPTVPLAGTGLDNRKALQIPLPTAGAYCLSLWTHKTGEGEARLAIDTLFGNSSRNTYVSVNVTKSPQSLVVNLFEKTRFRIALIGSAEVNTTLYIKPDSPIIGPCNNQPDTPFYGWGCNFDKDNCSMQESSVSEQGVGWMLEGGTRAFRYAPARDHTTGTGEFLMSSSHSSLNQSEETKVYTPELKAFRRTCIDYWYQFSGDTTDLQLKFSSSLNSYEKTIQTLPAETVRKGRWHHTSLEIHNVFDDVGKQTRFAFISSKGVSDDAAVSIDDVSIVPCDALIGHGECSFDKDFCGWTPVRSDTTVWLNSKQNPRDQFEYIRPAGDITGAGQYIFAERKAYGTALSAVLDSPLFGGEMEFCLTFYYNIPIINIGTLAIVRQAENFTETEFEIEMNGTSGWTKAAVPIFNKGSSFKLQLISRWLSDEGIGAVSVDDIKIKPPPGDCSWPTTIIDSVTTTVGIEETTARFGSSASQSLSSHTTTPVLTETLPSTTETPKATTTTLDIDECQLRTDNCAKQDKVCLNRVGSYECRDKNSNCVHSTETGRVECRCNLGYEGDYTHCQVAEIFNVSCPKPKLSQLWRGVDLMNVTWPMPRVIGVNRSYIKCEKCPSNTQELGVGIHTFQYVYTFTPSNYSQSCSVDIIVIASSGDQSCSPVLLGLKKGETTATFSLKSANGYASIELPVGVYRLNTSSPSGSSCSTAVKVYDTEPTGQHLAVQVRYPVECDQLNEISYAVIDHGLSRSYAILSISCSDCMLPKSQKPEVQCESNILKVLWKSDIDINSLLNEEISSLIKTRLEPKLKEIQQSQFESGGRFQDIIVIAGAPRIVFPVLNDGGLYVKLVVVYECPLPWMVYDDVDDACYIP